MESAQLGVIMLTASVVVGFISLWAWVKFFPSSRVGKKMFHGSTGKDWHGFETKNSELMGKSGIAHTMLRPSGTAEIEGQRYDVVSEGPVIPKDAPIEVVRVEGNRIVVAQVEEATESAAVSSQEKPAIG
jgi:membrane-bound serine protease (ClpP class)